MNNKVLVKVLIPEIDEVYDVFIPINIRIGMVIKLLNESLGEISNGLYVSKDSRKIYNVADANPYPFNKLVRETNIRNGSTVIFM